MPPTVIYDAASLAQFFSDYHDEYFELDSSTFDPDTRRWRGTFWRAAWNAAAGRWRIWPFWRTVSIPLLETTVTISGVVHCDVRDESRIGRYMFNDLESAGERLTFCFIEGLDIALSVENDWSAEIEIADAPSRARSEHTFLFALNIMGGFVELERRL